MRLNFKSFGEGEPVIIMHGLFGMLDNWKSFAKKLSENYTVYIIDLRNHGKSPHEPGISYSLMAQDVIEFLEAEWIYEARFIGHSMGGKVLLQLVEEYGDYITSAIVVDILPIQYKGGHQTIFDALLSAPVRSSDQRSQIEDHLATYIQEKSVIQFLMKNLSRDPNGGFRWKMNLTEIHKHYAEILAPISFTEIIDVPTLFVKGTKSDYVPAAAYEELSKQFETPSLISVEDAGHWIHAEKPDQLYNIVTEFFLEN